MKLVKLNCPNCNAKLDVNEEMKQFTCNYCGTTTLLDYEDKKDKPSMSKMEKKIRDINEMIEYGDEEILISELCSFCMEYPKNGWGLYNYLKIVLVKDIDEHHMEYIHEDVENIFKKIKKTQGLSQTEIDELNELKRKYDIRYNSFVKELEARDKERAEQNEKERNEAFEKEVKRKEEATLQFKQEMFKKIILFIFSYAFLILLIFISFIIDSPFLCYTSMLLCVILGVYYKNKGF